MKRLAAQALAYLGIAWLMLWPTSGAVPGGSRTDVWNSLWSLWFSHRELSAGRLPWSTELLNFPDGGTVLLPDLFASAFALIGVPILGVAGAYTALLLLRLATAGLVAHRFAADWLTQTGLDPDAANRAGFVAGVGFSTAPVLLAGAQCATTEAVNGAWPALAAWLCWRAVVHGGRSSIGWAALALLGAAIASWYAAVVAFVFAGIIVVFSPRTEASGWRARLALLGGGLALVLPLVAFTHMTHSDPGHVGTRSMEILATIRRSFGSTDLTSWILPRDEANIAIISPAERGQGYLHTTYLGATLLLGTALTLVRRVPGARVLALAGLVCTILALGPVLWINGDPTIRWMPYSLLEGMPGLGSLSLLWRLGVGAALAVALLGAAATRGHRLWVMGSCVLVLLEVRLISPIANGITLSSTAVPPALHALHAAPEGAVLTVPAVRQHQDLWWQTIHQKPVTGAINRGRSQSARDWLDHAIDQPLDAALANAQTAGIRYLIVHGGSTLRQNPNRGLVMAIEDTLTPIGEDEDLTIYALW